MNYLSQILQHLEQTNKIKGIVMIGMNITHLLFADDILHFVEDNDDLLRNL